MNSLHLRAISSSVLVALSVIGCGGGGTAATEDPLTGTWASDTCFGSISKPADVESCSVELAFMPSLDLEVVGRWISLAATAENPGCTTTRRIIGQEWSTNQSTNTLTVRGTGSATLERSGCVNPEDDLEPTPTSDIEVRPGNMKYEITDDTLRVLSGSLEGTYVR